MKVFLSWSGSRSKAVAHALRDWLPIVLHYVQPWMSEEDIRAGDRWASQIGKELASHDFGIICVTRDNLNAPWLLFEAGALSKSLEEGAVVPYLLDVDFSDVGGPLGQFQAKKAFREPTLKLIESLNARAAEPDNAARVQKLFDKCWEDLEGVLRAIPESGAEPSKPDLGRVLEELVTVVRGVDHRMRSLEEDVDMIAMQSQELDRSIKLRRRGLADDSSFRTRFTFIATGDAERVQSLVGELSRKYSAVEFRHEPAVKDGFEITIGSRDRIYIPELSALASECDVEIGILPASFF